jgi:hypothetical protein
MSDPASRWDMHREQNSGQRCALATRTRETGQYPDGERRHVFVSGMTTRPGR